MFQNLFLINIQPINLAKLNLTMKIFNFSRSIQGLPSYGAEFSLEYINDCKKAGFFREAIAELDSYIDYWLTQILRNGHQITYNESLKFIKDGLYGQKLAEYLLSQELIDVKTFDLISSFKIKRNLIIHSKFSHLSLVDPTKEKFMDIQTWEKLALQSFDRLQEKGENIIIKLQEISLQMPPSPD